MLSDISYRDLKEWDAFFKIEPDPWERLLTVIKLGFSAMCNTEKHHVDPEIFDPMNPARQELQRKNNRPKKRMSPNQVAAMLRSKYSIEEVP